MRIGIDFDDTIVSTTEKVKEYKDKYGIAEFSTDEEKTLFYRNYIEDIAKELSFERGALEYLKKLTVEHELYIITARTNYYAPNLKSATMDFIKNHQLPIKEVYFECFGIDKAKKCQELGIDLFIDDCYDNCYYVNKEGIDTLFYKGESNELKTVSSWEEIYNYIKKV